MNKDQGGLHGKHFQARTCGQLSQEEAGEINRHFSTTIFLHGYIQLHQYTLPNMSMPERIMYGPILLFLILLPFPIYKTQTATLHFKDTLNQNRWKIGI